MPIDTSKLDKFNPFDVPTISQICHELDKIKSELGDSKHKLGMKINVRFLKSDLTFHLHNFTVYMKTSLKPYMEFFTRKFLIPLKKNSPRIKGQFN